MYEDIIYQSGPDPCWIALTWSFGDDNDILVRLYEKVKLENFYDTLSKVRTLKCQVKSSFFYGENNFVKIVNCLQYLQTLCLVCNSRIPNLGHGVQTWGMLQCLINL